MAGFMPAIHVLLGLEFKDVDGIRNSGLPELRKKFTRRKSGIPDLR